MIFLRSDSDNIRELTININYPGGKASYKVPVLRIKDYTIEELLEKRLLILVPFLVFLITEKEYDEMAEEMIKQKKIIAEKDTALAEKDKEILRLKEELKRSRKMK